MRTIKIIFLSFPFFLILSGCMPPVIKMPDRKPDIVKSYRSVGVYGGVPGMQKSGIWVDKGDYITILADGIISLHPRDPTKSFGPSGRLLYRIGERNYASRYYYPHSFPVLVNGELYLGYVGSAVDSYGEPEMPLWYSDDTGGYSVDIIVWKRYDPVEMADFLEELLRLNPGNEKLELIALPIINEKRYKLAQEKAKRETEEAKKAIEALKGREVEKEKITSEGDKMPLSSEKSLQKEAREVIDTLKGKEALGVKDPEKERQIAELTEKLHKAMEALKELEELKKKVEQQKEREKEIMVRIQRMEEDKLKRPKTPPLIAIASPKDGVMVDSEYIIISGVAESEEGIVKLEILVNDRPVITNDIRALQIVARDLRRVEFSERISLREGINEIHVIAQDKEGLSSRKGISIQMAKKKEELWAVIVGIDKYRNLPNLKFAGNDAREFYKFLVDVNRIPEDHIWLLLDEDATLDKLRSILGTHLPRRAGRDDTVIIFFAGHGATERDPSSPDGDGLEKYFLPHNASLRDLYSSALPMNEIARIFQRISAERLVFLADTCYSGGSGGRTVPTMGIRTNISDAFLNRLTQGKGRIIITASDANEVSEEKEELKHGVFTYYLLEGLKGKADLDGDRLITVDELYRYISQMVPQATNQSQHPVKKGEMKGQIILGIIQ
jgi:hypothetical protein